MSSGSSAALALGLGVAGGAAIWYFTRGKKKGTTPDDKPNPTAPSQAAGSPSSSATAPNPAPPRVPAPCSLMIDKTGLTADGERVDVPTAVSRCKAAGKAEWLIAPDAPSAAVVELGNALSAAKVPVEIKK